jgi:hypothetical protein
MGRTITSTRTVIPPGSCGSTGVVSCALDVTVISASAVIAIAALGVAIIVPGL